MSKFVYLVEVETEKESGLIVSRYEQSERIILALEEAYPELTGLGARSDSVYGVTDISITELEARDQKEINAEYDRDVQAAEPSDSELRDALAAEMEDSKRWKSLYETQKAIVEQIVAGDPHEGSPVYMEPRKWLNDDEPRINLDPRERVFFQFGDHRSQRFSVQLSNYKDGSIEITADTMGSEFAVLPQSGNVVRVKVLERER